MIEIPFAYWFAALHSAIEQRLGEGRLITFVMPKPPVPIHIDDDVALELETKVER
jgi:hypothetical protein